jgi:hypothetical protein
MFLGETRRGGTVRFNPSDFDTIIILDACRYDYYRKFRTAHKILADATHTVSSIKHMFPFTYPDTVYVSGNPFINGRHVVFEDYDALDHFRFVDDVWLHGWEAVDGISTVPPWNLFDAAVKYQRRGYRTVVHFVQPHAPYIGQIKINTHDFVWSRNVTMGKNGQIPSPDEDPPDRNFDVPRLQEAYYHNLHLVLRYAVNCVNGTTCITADHGELLGEQGLFYHGSLQHPLEHPKLREIPLETFR